MEILQQDQLRLALVLRDVGHHNWPFANLLKNLELLLEVKITAMNSIDIRLEFRDLLLIVFF